MNLLAFSPVLSELPRQVEHPASPGAGDWGLLKETLSNVRGPGRGGAHSSGRELAAVAWGKEGRVLCAQQP